MSRSVSPRDERPASLPARSEAQGALAAGCLFSLASAALTCGLLFINGSLVLAILQVISGAGFDWVHKQEGLSQFVLFALPVVLVVIEWMMIDYLRSRLRTRSEPPSE